jgi:HK97 family phage prohead protease
MDTVYKTYRAEVKDVNLATGEVDMFIPVSTDSVDRDGEIVEPSAFRKTLPKFMKRPVLVSSHDYRDLTSQIGEWTRLKIAASGLEGKPKYYIGEGNDQADWGFKLASKGMAAFSIGFIPIKWTDGDGVKSPRRTYEEVELLEVSQVIVPSNRDAIQSIRSKSVDPVQNKLLDDVLADTELVTKPEETPEIEHKEKPVSQQEIRDELDYVIRLIDTEGMNDEVEGDFWNLVREGMRHTGNDIPEDIKLMFAVPVKVTEKEILDTVKRLVVQSLAEGDRVRQQDIEKLGAVRRIVNQTLADQAIEARKNESAAIKGIIKRKLEVN